MLLLSSAARLGVPMASVTRPAPASIYPSISLASRRPWALPQPRRQRRAAPQTVAAWGNGAAKAAATAAAAATAQQQALVSQIFAASTVYALATAVLVRAPHGVGPRASGCSTDCMWWHLPDRPTD